MATCVKWFVISIVTLEFRFVASLCVNKHVNNKSDIWVHICLNVYVYINVPYDQSCARIFMTDPHTGLVAERFGVVYRV